MMRVHACQVAGPILVAGAGDVTVGCVEFTGVPVALVFARCDGLGARTVVFAVGRGAVPPRPPEREPGPPRAQDESVLTSRNLPSARAGTPRFSALDSFERMRVRLRIARRTSAPADSDEPSAGHDGRRAGPPPNPRLPPRDKLPFPRSHLLRFESMVRRGRRGTWVAGGLAAVATFGLCVAHHRAASHGAAPTASAAALPSAAPDDSAMSANGDDARAHAFRVPSGRAPTLTCEAARAIVAQVRDQLAYAPDNVDAKAFADAPPTGSTRTASGASRPTRPSPTPSTARAGELLAELEGRGHARLRRGARARGGARRAGSDELRGAVRRGARAATGGRGRREHRRGRSGLRGRDRHAAGAGPRARRSAAASAPSSARSGPGAQPYVDAARARYFPTLDADGWARVVLAAAVRAYVPAIDPARRVGAARRGVERLRGRPRGAPAGAPLGQGRAHRDRRASIESGAAAAAGRRRRGPLAGGRGHGGPELRADASSSGSRRPRRGPRRRRSSCARARSCRSRRGSTAPPAPRRRRPAARAADDDDLPVERDRVRRGRRGRRRHPRRARRPGRRADARAPPGARARRAADRRRRARPARQRRRLDRRRDRRAGPVHSRAPRSSR